MVSSLAIKSKRANDGWETDYEVYTEEQIESILDECNIEIESETGTHFLCLCPFHGNTDLAAFAINKSKGLWNCFNPSCNNSGKLDDLPRRLLGMNIFQVRRLLSKHANANRKSLVERAEDRQKGKELPVFKQEVIDRMALDFWGSPAETYMRGRGFGDDTLKFFEVGYSAKKNMVAVPMYAEIERPVGVIGRRLPPVDHKYRFQNSAGLPKRHIPWNIQNARICGDTVIICEAAFDAMAIAQAGYPNVVALLGGYLTPWHHSIIDKTFSKIVLMTDFDEKRYDVNCAKCKSKGHQICDGHRPGRDFGRTIINQFPHKRVMWAAYDDTCVYPSGAKDASKMLELDPSGDSIRQTLKNTVSNFEYSKWNIENMVA